MRVSVNKNDPGFVADPYNYTVFLNNRRIDHCQTADEETGEVTVALDYSRCETLFGSVRIVREV